MKKTDFLKLQNKYLEGNASEEEEQLLLNFYNSFQQSMDWDEELGDKQIVEDEILSRIQTDIQADQKKVFRLFTLTKIASAAIILIILSVGYYWYAKPQKALQLAANDLQLSKKQNHRSDINPGKDQAVLTLADNSKIVLNSATNREISRQAGIHIKTINGEIIYTISGQLAQTNGHKLAYNTITTPKGGKYKIILPDKSAVWLNAASSLRYPTTFDKKERRVELTGEAYFEIAKLKQHSDGIAGAKTKKRVPFIVTTKNQIIEVFGTHFNISSYDDEPFVKTTLLEGSVKVSSPLTGNSKFLKSGQQAQEEVGSNQPIQVVDTDTEEAVAWKNDYFKFSNTKLVDVMKQLERWYNVKVEYTGEVPPDEFTGFISRKVKLSSVLDMLEQSAKVNFIIKDRVIKVKLSE